MYKFTYKNNTRDLWQMWFYYTYGSVAGMCNILFTCAMIILLGTMWDSMQLFFKIAVIIGCFLFPVIQPLLVWFRCSKDAKKIVSDTELTFSEHGIHVKVDDQDADIKWDGIKKIAKKPTLIVIYSGTTNGYILTNRILKDKKYEFYEFLLRKIEHK